MIAPGIRTIRWVVVSCLVLAILFALAFSRPVRLRYHKWRLVAAKQEHLRLGRGEYYFTDTLRELLLANPVTWAGVQSTRNHHEQRLVDLGFLRRQEYYARRGKVPSGSNREFARVVQQMEQACPWWSYSVSESETTLTVTATKEGLELWKQLAPSLKLQEDKPANDGRSGKKRCGRRDRRQRLDVPLSTDWSAVFGRTRPGTRPSQISTRDI